MPIKHGIEVIAHNSLQCVSRRAGSNCRLFEGNLYRRDHHLNWFSSRHVSRSASFRWYSQSVNASFEKPTIDEVKPLEPSNLSDPSITLSHHVRHCMRHVPNPIVVVTASTIDVQDDEGGPQPSDFTRCYGVTLSSFTTATLGPPAIINFNLRRPSHTLNVIRARRLFRVHVLQADHQGRAIANAFVQLAHGSAFQHLHNNGLDVRIKPFSERQALGPDLNGACAPNLSEGVLFSFECEALVDKFVEIGDHTVVFATIRAASEPQESENSASLIYYQQDYGVARRLDEDAMASIKSGSKEGDTTRHT